MMVLGIDPSYTATGYAVIYQQNNKHFLLNHGFLPLPATRPIHERVGMFYDYFEKIIIDLKITHITIETPFLGKNAQTFLKLGYLRGALHILAYRYQLKLIEFSPREIKLAVTGFGGAEKQQVARMVHMLFPNLVAQKTNDVTDAIAISLCGLWNKGEKRL
jgi:crossover junction endodeoxyribonuclease RuvC